MVRLEEETLNTLDELIDVFEDWDSILRASNFEQFADFADDTQDNCETECAAPHQDVEPGGMS